MFSNDSSSNIKNESGSSQTQSSKQSPKRKVPDNFNQQPDRRFKSQPSSTIQQDFNEKFVQRFGMVKQELMDLWLEMEGELLIQECKKYGLQPSERHIENIQRLFEYVKKVEADIQFQVTRKNFFKQQNQKQNKADQALSENSQDSLESYKSDDNLTSSDMNGTEKEQDNMFIKQKPQNDTFNFSQSTQSKMQNTQPVLSHQVEQAKESLNEQLQKILAKRKRLTQGLVGQVFQKESMKQNNRFQEENFPTEEEQAAAQYEGTQEVVNLHVQSNLLQSLQRRGQISQSLLQNQQAAQAPPFLNRFTETDKEVIDLVLAYPELEVNKALEDFSINLQDSLLGQLKFDTKQELEQAIKDPKKRPDIFGDFEKLKAYIDCIKLFQLDKEKSDAVRLLLTDDFLRESSKLYQDLNVNKVQDLSNFINFMSEIDPKKAQPAQLNKIRDYHHNKLKGVLTEPAIKVLEYESQYDILASLPEIEGDSIIQRKSLQHILLTELFQDNNYDRWFLFNKEQVFTLLDKTLKMNKCKDLQNKFRTVLLGVNYSSLTIQDIHKILLRLTENGQKGQIDAKIVTNALIKKMLKTFVQIPNSNEMSPYLDTFELIYKNSPMIYTGLAFEMKYLFYRLAELKKTQYFSLNDMVRMSKFLVPSLYEPNYFFKNMIEKDTLQYNPVTKQIEELSQNFKYDANLEDIYQLVDETIKRVEDNQHVFDHLQLSNSRQHRYFKPYKEKSFMIWWKITDDLISEGSHNIKPEENKIMNRIFSNEKVITNYFTDLYHLQRVINPILDSQIIQSTARLLELNQNQIIDQLIDKETVFENTINQLKALENILHISRNSEVLEKVTDVSLNVFGIVNEILFKSDTYELDEIFKLNYQMLNLYDKIQEINHETKLLNKTITAKNHQQLENLVLPLKDIILNSIEYFYEGKKPFVLQFEDNKRNLQISKKIQSETNNFLIDQNLQSIIAYFNHTNIEDLKHLALKFCQSMRNSRALVGQDLVQLYNLIDKYGLGDQAKTLMVNTAANLQTIERPRINRESADNEQAFEVFNRKIDDKLNDIKRKIINKFSHLQQQAAKKDTIEDPLKKETAILGPLSKIMADVMDQMEDDEVLTCLKILGNQKVDNYHEDFIKKIYERFASSSDIQNIYNNNPKLFFKIAKTWPYFLRNNAIMNQLLEIKGSSALPKQQQEILGILTQQNVLHPELLQSHFETFIKMKDKQSVSMYLKEYLNYAAYLGFQDFDIQKCVQIFRRIHHTPQEVPDIQQILNLLLILANSGAPYKEYDDKSVKFIEDAIELVDEKFQCVEKAIVDLKDEITGETEKMEIKYFKSIPSSDKIYHKFQIPGIFPRIDTVQTYNTFKNNYQEISDDEKSAQVGLFEEEKINLKFPLSLKAKGEEISQNNFKEIPSTTDGINGDIEYDSSIKEALQLFKNQEDERNEGKKTQNQTKNDQIDEIENQHELNMRQKAESQKIREEEEEENIDNKKKEIFKEIAKSKNRRIYDSKASEANYSEELEFHQYRKKKLLSLDKKAKHLLLFSNINQMNFVDINKSDVVKAWTVLLYFKSKSEDSVLFDEFQSVTMRNSTNKGKGHELFTHFYLELVEQSYVEQFRLKLAHKCEITGWPIDILLTYHESKMKVAIQFLLQEELCFNTKSFKEEPLGIQKLMTKHLKSFGDYHSIIHVSENDYFSKKEDPLYMHNVFMAQFSPYERQLQDVVVIYSEKGQQKSIQNLEKADALNLAKNLKSLREKNDEDDDDMFGSVNKQNNDEIDTQADQK